MAWPTGRQNFGVNRAPLLSGLDSATGTTEVPLAVDSSTGALIVEGGGGGGGGTQYAEGATTSPGTGTLAIGRYNTSAPTLTNGELYGLQLDSSGNLKVTATGGTAGTQYQELATTTPATGTLALGRYQSTLPTLTTGQMNEPMLSPSSILYSTINDGTNTANVVAGDTGFNGVVTNASTKSYIFTTSGTGAQTIGPFNCEGFSMIAIQNIVNSTVGLSQTATFSQTSGGTYVSTGSWQNVNIASNTASGTLGSIVGQLWVSAIHNNWFQISVSALTSGTWSGTITLSNRSTAVPALTVNASQTGTWTVGSSSATGSAVPANAFYIAVKDGSGNLIGLANGSSQGDGTTGNTQITNTQLLWNGASYDRERAANAASNTTGTGLLGVGNLGYDGNNWQSLGALVGDTGFNSMPTSAGTKSFTFTTSTSGAQVFGPYNCEGYAFVSIQYTVNTTAGLALTGQFSQTTGGTYASVNTFTSTASGANTYGGLATSTGAYHESSVKDNFFRINVTALTSGTLTGTITFSNRPNIAGAAFATQSGNWNVGSSSATGSAVPANAFYIGVGSGGNLSGITAPTADALGPTAGVGAFGMSYNGTNWDRVRSASGASTGTIATATLTSTLGGSTPYSYITTASTNATNVKASAGTLYSLVAMNTSASARYIHMYNSASAPTAGSGTPIARYLVPIGGGFTLPIPPQGIAYSSGIGFTITGGVADTDTTNTAASDVVLNLSYS